MYLIYRRWRSKKQWEKKERDGVCEREKQERDGVCVCERECKGVCVCMRGGVRGCVWWAKRGSKGMCVCLCVCVWERETEGVREE